MRAYLYAVVYRYTRPKEFQNSTTLHTHTHTDNNAEQITNEITGRARQARVTPKEEETQPRRRPKERDPPPLPPPAYRGATEGPGPPSYVGSSKERPCPHLGLCAPPSAPAGQAVGGWASPDGCTCRVKPRLRSPPPPPTGRHTGCCAPVLRGAPLTVCPTCCPATPCRIAAYLCLPCPPTEGGGGGGAVPHRGERWTTLSLTPLTQSP